MGEEKGAWTDPLDELPPDPEAGDSALLRTLVPVGRSGWAIAAGYLGLFAILLVPAPLALAAGIMAVIDLRKHPKKHGLPRAIFGIFMGLVCTAGLLLWILDPGPS